MKAIKAFLNDRNLRWVISQSIQFKILELLGVGKKGFKKVTRGLSRKTKNMNFKGKVTNKTTLSNLTKNLRNALKNRIR